MDNVTKREQERKELMDYCLLKNISHADMTDKYDLMGYPYKGQLLTLKYFNEVLHKKAQSLKLIEVMWENAREYYKSLEQRSKEIMIGIQKQLQNPPIVIKYDPSSAAIRGRKKGKKLIDLNTIMEEIDNG